MGFAPRRTAASPDRNSVSLEKFLATYKNTRGSCCRCGFLLQTDLYAEEQETPTVTVQKSSEPVVSEQPPIKTTEF